MMPVGFRASDFFQIFFGGEKGALLRPRNRRGEAPPPPPLGRLFASCSGCHIGDMVPPHLHFHTIASEGEAMGRYSVLYAVVAVVILTLMPGLLLPANADPPRFTITDLGPLPSSRSAGTDINDLGHVVGLSFTPSPTQTRDHGTFWVDMSILDLGPIQFHRGRFLHSINNNDEISGTIDVSGGSAAARWVSPDYSAPQILPSLSEAIVSVGDRINAIGQIAGVSGEQPVRWTGTSIVEALDPLPGGNTRGDAYGINDSGQVTGWTLLNGRGYGRAMDGNDSRSP